MQQEKLIKPKQYKSAFNAWAEAIMRLNEIDGRKPVDGVLVMEHYRQGSGYARYLPELIVKMESLDLGSQEVPIQDLCDKTITWFHQIEKEKTEPGSAGQSSISGIGIDVMKSDLLGRLIYGQEILRTRPCPVHKGRWSGLAGEWNGGCDKGCDLTGWLPEGLDEQYGIPEMLEERRQRAIKRAEKFISDNPTSPFTGTPDPEKAWKNWKKKEARSLRVNPAKFGIIRAPRPTPRELKEDEWWQNFDIEALEDYLGKTGWKHIQISETENKRSDNTSWWKYQRTCAISRECETYFNLPQELKDLEFPDTFGIIQVPTEKMRTYGDLSNILYAMMQDIADVTDSWLIDVVCASQEIGVQTSDLMTSEFLKTFTPEMFRRYLLSRNWINLGDDGDGNEVWQHDELPKIIRDVRVSPPTTRYMSASMITNTLEHDSDRAVKISTHQDYDDYDNSVEMLLNDLHRHENRDKNAIANDVLATVRQTQDRQISLLPRD